MPTAAPVLTPTPALAEAAASNPHYNPGYYPYGYAYPPAPGLLSGDAILPGAQLLGSVLPAVLRLLG
jgi:hypothetical protein